MSMRQPSTLSFIFLANFGTVQSLPAGSQVNSMRAIRKLISLLFMFWFYKGKLSFRDGNSSSISKAREIEQSGQDGSSSGSVNCIL